MDTSTVKIITILHTANPTDWRIACAHLPACTCVHRGRYVCMYVCMCVCVHKGMCVVCVHVCVCARAHVHACVREIMCMMHINNANAFLLLFYTLKQNKAYQEHFCRVNNQRELIQMLLIPFVDSCSINFIDIVNTLYS